MTILTILAIFDKWDNWDIFLTILKRQSWRLVTFETLITFLIIENNNFNIHSDPWLKRWGDMTMTMTNTKTKTMTKTNTLRAPSKSDPSDLWHLRHWLHFWQLRTWFLDNLCYLTIKSDTGQHSQFLRCFIFCVSLCICSMFSYWYVFSFICMFVLFLYVCLYFRRGVVGVRLGHQLQLAPIPSAQLCFDFPTCASWFVFTDKIHQQQIQIQTQIHKVYNWNQEKDIHSIFALTFPRAMLICFSSPFHIYILTLTSKQSQ